MVCSYMYIQQQIPPLCTPIKHKLETINRRPVQYKKRNRGNEEERERGHAWTKME